MLKVLPCNSGNLFGVCPDVSLFTSDSAHLWPLFLFVGLLGQGSVNLASVLKNPGHRLIDFFVLFFCFCITSFCSGFYYLLLSSGLGFGLFLFFQSFEFPH